MEKSGGAHAGRPDPLELGGSKADLHLYLQSGHALLWKLDGLSDYGRALEPLRNRPGSRGSAARRVAVQCGVRSAAVTTAAALRADAVTSQTVERFDTAVHRRDVDALRAVITDDCIFESPGAPDGNRFVGPGIVDIFATVFAVEIQEMFTAGDRAVVRWLHSWDLRVPAC